MPYVYLICAIVTSATLAICGTLFNEKNAHRNDVGHLYNFMGACSNCLTWLIAYLTAPTFAPGVLLYSTLYGVSYVLFWIGLTGALQCGSSALTGFVKQIAFVFVAIWGFLFWDSPLTAMVGTGILLIAIALFLCLVPIGKQASKGSVRITGKWLIYAFLVLVGNAGCSIIQKTQQASYNGLHGSQLMVFATLFAAIACLAFCRKDDKSVWPDVIRRNWYFPVIAGASSAVCNLFIIRMASTDLSPSFIYPALAVGGLTLTTLVSVVICKEKLRLSQWIGIAVGAVALILLNI